MKKGKLFCAAIILLALIGSSCTSSGNSSGDTIYVNASASGSNNGSSWENACTSLADALSSSSSGDEIWVAAGTYYPTTGTDRTASFTLVSGVSVYGGFAGTETSLNERDYSTNTTILSGDIDGDNIRDGENSYHVVTGADDATLDGFTIEMGYAVVVGTPPDDLTSLDGIITYGSYVEILRILEGVNYIAGAGMLNIHAAPTVKNCTFQNNYAGKGGLYTIWRQRTSLQPKPMTRHILKTAFFRIIMPRAAAGPLTMICLPAPLSSPASSSITNVKAREAPSTVIWDVPPSW